MTGKTSMVGLSQGQDRRSNVLAAMNLVRDDLVGKISDQVLVKPNFLSSTNQLASSHVDALRGILDFLSSLNRPPTRVTIAEGANEKYSGEAFDNFGFTSVVSEYAFDIKLIDLHQTAEWAPFPVLQVDGSEVNVRIPKLILEHPCTISLAIPKTHDGCVVTLALKNMIMGTMHKPDRIRMHGVRTHAERVLSTEVLVLNANLARLARHLYPDIAVLDGTVGLQGDGPGGTDGVDFRLVAVSADVFAADTVMAKAMGFDPSKLAQTRYAEILQIGESDIDNIQVVGADLDAVAVPFKPHTSTDQQYNWASERMEKAVAA